LRATPVVRRQKGDKPLQPTKILIVEDQKVLGDNLQRYLRPRGWDTLVVHSGAMALEALSSFRPNMLLLDCHLPDMSGSEVLGALDVRQNCRCVLMTAHPRDCVAEWARGHGITRILCKPFSLDEMEGHLLAARTEPVAPGGPSARSRV